MTMFSRSFTRPILTLATLCAVAALSFVLFNASPAYGQTLAEQAQQGVDAVGGAQDTADFGSVVVDVINFLLFAVGILSVIMIIVGGIRYVVSAGDSNAVTGARNTILYSIVGLVVALVAYGIVNFVVSAFSAEPEEEAAETSSLIQPLI